MRIAGALSLVSPRYSIWLCEIGVLISISPRRISVGVLAFLLEPIRLGNHPFGGVATVYLFVT